MGYFARNLMRLRTSLVTTLILFLVNSLGYCATDAPRSFSLSTSRTFAPGESVKIQLFARNVPQLEFRVYRVRDPQKFFAGLKDLHSFGIRNETPREQIDQRTLLERLHDFKADLWWRVRHFFRGQFTDAARDSFREQQAKLGKKSRIVGAAQFAQIPLLNDSQLVARWKLETPPAIVSETQQLPIDGLGAGAYLIEATDGTYKAYTVAIVTAIAVVERAINEQANLFVADRKTGAPIEKADVALWTGAKLQSSGQTSGEGLATLSMTSAEKKQPDGAESTEPENVWILAQRGADIAIVTPWGYSFNRGNQRSDTAYVYTDRPVYRPGHSVHIKGVIRRKKDDVLQLPEEKTAHLSVTDADNKELLSKDTPVSSHGTINTDLELESDAGLGFYNITMRANGSPIGSGSFYVEDYKKPEYQVTVKPTAPRILQGNSLQAIIEARYFFGEPVANAKVKYVVHTSTHFWWGEDGSDQETDAGGEGEGGEDSDSAWGATEQQEHESVLDANGRLTVTLPVAIDGKHNDQAYRIEARVTDSANREVSGHATTLATYGSFRLSAEPTSYVLQLGQTARVKVTAQDYDGKPVQTPVHIAVSLTKWDSATHERTQMVVAAKDATTGADGNALVELPSNMGSSGSGNFEITATAQTLEKRTVEGKTWVWIWNGQGAWYSSNTQAQIVPDKKTYKVGDIRSEERRVGKKSR